MNGHSFAATHDNERVECTWCLASPLSAEGQAQCPEILYREARDRLQASRSAKVHVVHEGDVELDKMAEYFGHDNKEEQQ